MWREKNIYLWLLLLNLKFTKVSSRTAWAVREKPCREGSEGGLYIYILHSIPVSTLYLDTKILVTVSLHLCF